MLTNEEELEYNCKCNIVGINESDEKENLIKRNKQIEIRGVKFELKEGLSALM